MKWWCLVLVSGLLVLGDAAPAAASCVPTPVGSVHRFVGRVTAVDEGGRRATVRTVDGREVVVHGNDAAGPGMSTSVDRFYDIGLWYEFHPRNAASPYRDNACTATHRIAPPPSPRAMEYAATPPVRRTRPWPVWPAVILGVAAAAAGCWLVRAELRSMRVGPVAE